MPKTITPTRTFTAKALDDELGRRKNNRERVRKAIANGATKAEAQKLKKRAKSFVFPELSHDDIAAIKAGEVVKVEFHSGRIEHVGLKTD